ncbi:MAG: 3-keto-5-aminohexanoate cleavage protein [Chloroflexota bacterium]|nr:3-keto-5-aminohexanoate cleavage protein [Chloroflexota bacterium]
MAAAARKVIISCAITGAIHIPSQTPYLPITPDQIAESAIGAANAGAAILHLHARTPENGYPTPDPAVFAQFLPRIKANTGAIINITTGGAHHMTIEERLAGPLAMQPEMCSLNLGSMNFGLYPMMSRIKEYQHDWEKDYLERSSGTIFRNTFADIESIVTRLGAHGTRFEFECYDIGHLYNLAHMLDRGVVRPPLFVQTIFGILGGVGTDVEDLLHMRRTADRLFGDAYLWSILGAGRHQINLTTMGAIMGGNVRTGLEDNIYIGKGELAKSNADLVAKMVRILGELSLEPATPDETRSLLKLKGSDQVAF